MKKAQELPGWAMVLGLVMAIIVIILIIYFAVKSGKATGEQLVGFP